MPKMENGGKLRQIPLDQIIVTDNVRTDYTDIEELAASIEMVGQLEPVLVKHIGKNSDTQLDEYELVAGYRRRLAHILLKEKGNGYTSIDAIIVQGDKLTIQLVENLQRADLTPKDREAGICQLAQSGISNKEIAARLSKSEPFVSRNLAAHKVRSSLVQAVMEQIKSTDSMEDAGVWLQAINDLSTQALCEIQGVKKGALIAISKKLIDGGGTVACARQLMREYNAPRKEPAQAPAKETKTDDVEEPSSDDSIDPLVDEENTLDTEDGASVDTELYKKLTAGDTAPKSPPAKKSSQPPARTLEEPPHKQVSLNSVQVVIRDYIEKISKNEAGYEFEYKTDAAYEIWSLLLEELAEA